MSRKSAYLVATISVLCWAALAGAEARTPSADVLVERRA